MTSNARFTQTLPSAVPTPDANKRSLFLNADDGKFYAKSSSGAIAPLEISSSGLANVVLVNSEDDLPAAVSGIRTFPDNTTYLISGTITTGDELVLGDNVGFIGTNRFTDSLNYSGTGTFITATESCNLQELLFTATSGTLLDYDAASSQTFYVAGCFALCGNVGDISGSWNTVFRSFSFVSVTGTGLTFTGAQTSLNMDNSLWQGFQSGQTMIDLGTATFDRIQIPTGNRFNAATGVTVLSGAANDANLNPGGDGIITHNIFEGDGTYLSGLDVNDLQYEYIGNAGLPDSMADAHITMITNATATTISVINTPVLIAGVWAEQTANRFTTDVNGRSTYNGVQPITVPIVFNCSVVPSSGANKDLSIYLAINGTVQAFSQSQARIDSGNPLNLTTVTQVTLVNGDYVECFTENNSDTTNIVIDKAKLIIN